MKILQLKNTITEIKNVLNIPGQCGSVGWTLSHKSKGHRFDSLSGHMTSRRFGPQRECVGKATN